MTLMSYLHPLWADLIKDGGGIFKKYQERTSKLINEDLDN